MKTEDFKAWRKQMGFTQPQAAQSIGVSRQTIENYERGHRLENRREVIIPLTVALACSAVSNNLKPWGAE